tara:strand:- start:614 stop:1504 length:891 start_codon:yes stop_codon:yes gene_type:complete
MEEWVEFENFVTKGITIESGDERRIFKGHMTAEIIDRQNEFIFQKEVMSIMENYMSVNPVISDFHSNRMVGQVLKYEASEYEGVATVLITGEVYKKDGVTLYDKVWDKVLKGEYAGLSMGGASKEREPIMKDGKMALELRKLELYEIALCETPANPFAVIESVNTFAKTAGMDQEMIKEANGREYIQCTSLSCKFEKGVNVDADADVDNKKETHGVKEFDKPVEKDHIPSVSEEVEEKAKAKNKEIEKETVPEDRPKGWNQGVNAYIKHFGIENVKKAIEEHETLEYLKSLHRKYN